jgi:hypothetical protein
VRTLDVLTTSLAEIADAARTLVRRPPARNRPTYSTSWPGAEIRWRPSDDPRRLAYIDGVLCQGAPIDPECPAEVLATLPTGGRVLSLADGSYLLCFRSQLHPVRVWCPELRDAFDVSHRYGPQLSALAMGVRR